jgi:exopolysaccharide biosynthesis polyprenyl glycosylphosphotransferase
MSNLTNFRTAKHHPNASRLRLAARNRGAARTDNGDFPPVVVPASGARWARSYRLKLRASDMVTIAFAVTASFFARFHLAAIDDLAPASSQRYAFVSVVMALVWILSLGTFRTRDARLIGVGASEYRRVIHASTTVFGAAAIMFLVSQVDTARWFFIVGFPLGLLGLLGTRWGWRRWLTAQRRFGHYLSRVVVVGRRTDVEKVVRQIHQSSGATYSVVGAVLDGDDVELDGGKFGDVRIWSGLDRVVDHAASLGADGIVVAGQPGGESDFIHDLAWKLEGQTIDLILATSLANVAGPRIHFRPVDGLPLLHVEIPHFEGGKHVLKRGLDIAVSSIALLMLCPLFLVLALIIKADSDGRAFFSQERVGRGGRTFHILKFRSMVATAPEQLSALIPKNEGNGVLFKMKNDPRVTRIGRLLRKYSLDEFPQFWNVLVGDMSLVGPRPPLPSEVQGYEDHVRRRLYIKPGITGMWQINGRSALSWEDSVRLDLYYVENWSVVGDLMIMWRTFYVLIHPVGAY